MYLPTKSIIVNGKKRKVLDVSGLTEEQCAELADEIWGDGKRKD